MPDQAIQYCLERERERETTHEPDHGEWQTWDQTTQIVKITELVGWSYSLAELPSPLLSTIKIYLTLDYIILYTSLPASCCKVTSGLWDSLMSSILYRFRKRLNFNHCFAVCKFVENVKAP